VGGLGETEGNERIFSGEKKKRVPDCLRKYKEKNFVKNVRGESSEEKNQLHLGGWKGEESFAKDPPVDSKKNTEGG